MDKERPDEPYRSGNELYHWALEEVIRHALEISLGRDAEIIVDESRFINVHHQGRTNATDNTGLIRTDHT